MSQQAANLVRSLHGQTQERSVTLGQLTHPKTAENPIRFYYWSVGLLDCGLAVPRLVCTRRRYVRELCLFSTELHRRHVSSDSRGESAIFNSKCLLHAEETRRARQWRIEDDRRTCYRMWPQLSVKCGWIGRWCALGGLDDWAELEFGLNHMYVRTHYGEEALNHCPSVLVHREMTAMRRLDGDDWMMMWSRWFRTIRQNWSSV